MNEWPNCEICGVKAVSVIRDLIRDDAMDGSYRFTPEGEWHYYCAEHDRESVTHDS